MVAEGYPRTLKGAAVLSWLILDAVAQSVRQGVGLSMGGYSGSLA